MEAIWASIPFLSPYAAEGIIRWFYQSNSDANSTMFLPFPYASYPINAFVHHARTIEKHHLDTP